ncbi:MAG: Sel1 repeat, partial [Planctomycetota bacterium]
MTTLPIARFARLSMISVVCPMLFTLSAHGFDGRRDPTEVSTLAAQGDRDAMFVLGSMYANGRGVVENDTLAGEWYRKAAALGEPR